jgi:hypothetical protein
MNLSIFERLRAEELLSESSLEKVRTQVRGQLFSLHYELKTLLYLGVLLLSSGLGILIYKNIDTIGHQVVILLIMLVSAGSFTYCLKRKRPFSLLKVEAPTPFFDYILLLGCLTFITLVGYTQVQYTVFGERYGLAFFIPLVVLLFSAYYFDHIGVLTLAITNLAAWCGIAVTPDKILSDNDFDDERLIITGLLLGALLTAVAYVSKRFRVKAHFAFTYSNFGIHLLFISCLAAMLHFGHFYFLWFLLLLGIAGAFYWKAVQERSFYFLLVLTLYTYIGLSYVVILLLAKTDELMAILYMSCIYFIVSAIAVTRLLIRLNRQWRTYDSLS